MRLADVRVMVPFDAAPSPVADCLVFQADGGARIGQDLGVISTAAKAVACSRRSRAVRVSASPALDMVTRCRTSSCSAFITSMYSPNARTRLEQFVGRRCTRRRRTSYLIFVSSMTWRLRPDECIFIALFAPMPGTPDMYDVATPLRPVAVGVHSQSRPFPHSTYLSAGRPAR